MKATLLPKACLFGFLVLVLVAPLAVAGTPTPDGKPEPELPRLLASARTGETTELLPGLEYRLMVLPADGLAIHTFAFDLGRFGLRTAQQKDETGDHAADFLRRPEDVFAIDGGFFERDDGGRLSPSGLLVVEGVEVAPEHERAGSGILHVDETGVSIAYRAEAPPAGTLASAVQVGPVLVDPGGQVGIRSPGVRDRRSAICLRPGEIVAIVVDGDGLSLLRLAEFLAAATTDGGVGCDIAINLDGGPSTQAIYRGAGPEIVIPGKSTVQNAVVLSILPQ
jgi:hypothetical protein